MKYSALMLVPHHKLAHILVRDSRQRHRITHVRFGSKADICSAKRHVRYGPTVFGWPFIAAAQEILFSEAAIRCLEE